MPIAVALNKPGAELVASIRVCLRRRAHPRLWACMLGVVVCAGILAGCDRAGRGLATFQAPNPSLRASTSTGSKTAIPLPSRTLLARQPEPDCEFKAGEADADGVKKLDYERQCYRHAEMIARGRLELLQSSVDRTIKAVARGQRSGS
jgi:hypothetical protein